MHSNSRVEQLQQRWFGLLMFTNWSFTEKVPWLLLKIIKGTNIFTDQHGRISKPYCWRIVRTNQIYIYLCLCVCVIWYLFNIQKKARLNDTLFREKSVSLKTWKCFHLKFVTVTIWHIFEVFERSISEASRSIVLFYFLAWSESTWVFVVLFFLKCTFVLDILFNPYHILQ